MSVDDVNFAELKLYVFNKLMEVEVDGHMVPDERFNEETGQEDRNIEEMPAAAI